MKRTYIHNARIVNEGQTFEGAIVIENEVIAEVLKAGEQPAHLATSPSTHKACTSSQVSSMTMSTSATRG